VGRWQSLWGVAIDCRSGKRKTAQEVAFVGCTYRRLCAVHRGLCFPVCNPVARRQGYIKPNGCRSIAAGVSESTSDIVTASGIINARASRPTHQLGEKRTGGYKAFLSSLQRPRGSARLEQL